MLFALLLLAPDAGQDTRMTPAEVLEMHRTRWAVNPKCRETSDESEITVCARREADKYRVPLELPYRGPDTDQGRLTRLFDGADGHAPCGEGAFTVRCGSVGVTGTLNASGVHYVRRQLAP
jgi:hypothetical protein